MNIAHSLPILWLGSLLTTLAAQDLTSPAEQPRLPAVVPIHSMPAEADATYGVWAAGPTWKASFHTGYTFYPWVPGAQRTLGWQWRTVAVTVDGHSLPLAQPAMATSEQRCEFDLGDVVEAYDLREQGVEQTFVITALPNRGELVVTGAVTTPFTAGTRAPGFGPIDFVDGDGDPVMRYGSAVAFDAAGRVTDVRTSFADGELRLVVDAAFVAAAELPITIDPLTSATVVGTSSATTRVIHATTIAAGTAPGNALVCTGHILEFSATDFDVYGYRYVEGASAVTSTFTDIASANSVTKVDVCEVAGSSNFIWVVQREFAAAPIQCATFLQTFSATLNSGTSLTLPSGYSDPQIGGGPAGQAMIVSTETLPSGSRRVRGQIVQAAGIISPPLLGPAFDLHSFASSADSFDPAVSDGMFFSTGGSQFLVWGTAWISAFGATGGNEVRVGQYVLDQASTVTTTQSLGLWVDGRDVQIGGAGGRYLALWQHTPTGLARGVRSARFDLSPAGALNLIEARQVTSSALATTSYQLANVAFNTVTQSHWASGYRTRNLGILGGATTNTGTVLRHGYTGGVVETQQLTATNSVGVGNLSLAFLGGLSPSSSTGFGVCYSTVQSSPTNPVWFRQFDAAAGVQYYGASCRSVSYSVLNLPYAGSQYYSLGVTGLPPGTPGLMLFGVASANIPLGALGMGSCTLLVSYDVLPSFVTDGAGQAAFQFALPDSPAFLGHFYAQALWFEAGANPLALVTAQGIDMNIQ